MPVLIASLDINQRLIGSGPFPQLVFFQLPFLAELSKGDPRAILVTVFVAEHIMHVALIRVVDVNERLPSMLPLD